MNQLAFWDMNPKSDLDRKARNLSCLECPPPFAVSKVKQWHSRLPNVQSGPWQFAFLACLGEEVVAVALWHNPSARMLPSHWLELRRLACSPDAPRNTCSWFLARMAKFFRLNHPSRERLISYQDTAVHLGTIYKASGWDPVATSKPRLRDRSRSRTSVDPRMYRTNMNGNDVDGSAKTRWEKVIGAIGDSALEKDEPFLQTDLFEARP